MAGYLGNSVSTGLSANTISSIPLSLLLKNVEKSNERGRKLLDHSRILDENGENTQSEQSIDANNSANIREKSDATKFSDKIITKHAKIVTQSELYCKKPRYFIKKFAQSLDTFGFIHYICTDIGQGHTPLGWAAQAREHHFYRWCFRYISSPINQNICR
jgi:hypothetical protein